MRAVRIHLRHTTKRLGYPTGIDPVLPVSQTSVQATTLWTPLLAPGVGIEPTIAESKSVVLPLHYPGINLVEAVRFELTASYLGGSGRIRTHGAFLLV